MTEQNPFGPHIMDAYVNLGNAWTYLDEAQPASTLWFNNHGGAQECKRRYPWMHVVHRQVNDNQQKWHEVTTPEQWYAEHKVFGANGVIIQCYNEPGGDFRNNAAYRNAVIDFMLGVWRLGARDGVAIGGPTFPTGNPHESRIVDGSFDRMIIEACANPFAWMFFHEYWHTDPVAEYPWMVGRHEFWYDRADTIGLNLARVLLTEYGMDKGGGVDDGYLNQGVSGQAYGQQNIRSRSVLERKPPVNIFAFGKGWGWWSFDMDNDEVKNEIKGYRETVEQKPVTYTWIEGRCESVPGTFVNVRSARAIDPSNVVGKMLPGMAVQYSTQTVDDNGYRWTPLNWNGITRWVAVLNLTTGAPVAVLSANPPPKPLEWALPVDLTAWSITSGFGVPRDYDGDGVMDDQHEGIDFAPAQLTESSMFVRAMADGIVEKARWLDEWLADRAANRPSNYGCYVRIKSQDGAQVYSHWYVHLSTPMVENGALVKRGQAIGVVGDTGNSRGTKWGGLHLHITIQAAGKGSSMGGLPNVIDPAVLLSELA